MNFLKFNSWGLMACSKGVYTIKNIESLKKIFNNNKKVFKNIWFRKLFFYEMNTKSYINFKDILVEFTFLNVSKNIKILKEISSKLSFKIKLIHKIN